MREASACPITNVVKFQQTCIDEEDVKVGGNVAASQKPHKCEKPGCYVGVCCRHCKLAHNIEPPWKNNIVFSDLQLPAVCGKRTYTVGWKHHCEKSAELSQNPATQCFLEHLMSQSSMRTSLRKYQLWFP